MRSPIAVQMYTIRDFTQTASDLAESLKKIQEIGYPAVQLSAVGAMSGDSPEVSAELARKMLDDHGLKCVATHRDWGALANETQKEIDFHGTLGCDFAAIGGLPGSYREKGEAGYRAFVQESAPAIAKMKAAGIGFGYHNHAHEFERASYKDGAPFTLIDIFIEEGGPDFCMELDLYWISHSGANPERVVERCAGRMPVIHVKDKEMDGGNPVMAPIGEGNLDWKRLIPACEAAGTEWYAVEQDTCRRDPFDCLKSSFEYLKRFFH
jgi:sugar phosphate isomerase/epimerase